MKFASSSRMKPHWCASSWAIVHGTVKNGLSTLMFDSMVNGKNMPPMFAYDISLDASTGLGGEYSGRSSAG